MRNFGYNLIDRKKVELTNQSKKQTKQSYFNCRVLFGEKEENNILFYFFNFC